MSLVVLMSLLWGGCLSCAQYFMLPGIPAHDCCAPSGHCEKRSTPQSQSGCKIQAMSASKQSLPDHAVILAVSVTPVAPISVVLRDLYTPATPVGFDPTPPGDLGLLHSVLRI